jgi:ABC transporter substrate binding protein
VGVISHGGSYDQAIAGLREGLKDLGWEHGAQYLLHMRDGHGDLKAVVTAATSLEAEKIDLICALSTSTALTVKQATKRVPIVFHAGTDPAKVGLVESFRRPGGRLTGVYSQATDLTAKRLEVLKEMVPGVRRVLAFYNPDSAADDVTVAPGLQRIQHEDAVARADERRFQVFPQVARGLEPNQGLRRRRVARGQRLQQRGHSALARGDGEARADCLTVTVQDGNPVLPQCHIDADKPLRHGTPFARRRGTARISRTGATGREVSMAWSNVRDGGEPSPSILDECSRPGGRGATFSVDGCSRRSAEVRINQSSFPSCLRTDSNRTLLLPTRGIATTLAGASRS